MKKRCKGNTSDELVSDKLLLPLQQLQFCRGRKDKEIVLFPRPEQHEIRVLTKF
jgi:hypothetical protein